MKNQLVPTRPGIPAPTHLGRVEELLKAFFLRRSKTTIRAYEADLRDFARYLGVEGLNSAIRQLISQGPGRANSLVLQYKGSLIDAGKSPATINRRLSALRSVITLAKSLGIIAWTLDISNERAHAYRDTRGPGSHGVKAILSEIKGNSSKAKRDRAIVRLLYDLALRRGEVVSLRLQDADLENGRLWIEGKGRRGEREALTLPPETIAVLREWIEARGQEPGPIFSNYDRAGKGCGLTGSGIFKLVKRLSRKAGGTRTSPHGIRHAAITEALDRTGDPRAVQRFSRHADLKTVMLYDDNREDLAGKVAKVVASGL